MIAQLVTKPWGDRETAALKEDPLGLEAAQPLPRNAIHDVGDQRDFDASGSEDTNEQSKRRANQAFTPEQDRRGRDKDAGCRDDQPDTQAF